jgi:trans-aconitate methyltransferase
VIFVPVNALAPTNNEYYWPLLLRELPVPCGRVLDVGCGEGEFTALLARRAAEVDALDRDPGMIASARSRLPATVRCIEADVLEHPLPDAHYDAVTSIATLHHLPLDQVLPRLAATLRPGGVLVATALPRADLPRDLPLEGVAALANAGRRAVLRAIPAARRQAAAAATGAAMPVRDPELTTREVRARAEAHLPGVRVRRLLLWRYLLVWRKPAE